MAPVTKLARWCRARAFAAALTLGIVAISAPALALVYACSTTPAGEPYVAMTVPIGDSIDYGVWAELGAGWREPLYNLSRAGGIVDRQLYFTGTQSFAGNGNGLAADPWNEGRPGWCVRSGSGTCNSLIDISANAGNRGAVIAILAGGTNDLASNVLNDSAATVISSISSWLDYVWFYRTTPRYQIVLCEILKRLDADDAKVVVVNAALPGVIASKAFAANITLIHMYDAIVRPVIGQGMHDAVHPQDEGYTDMANRMWTGGLQTAIVRSKG